MEVTHKLQIITLAFALSSLSDIVMGQDFTEARKAVMGALPNINYETFCSEKSAGGDKLACRIKSVPTVGFLVCKMPEIEEVACKVIIDQELKNLKEVQAGGVKTVKVSPPSISKATCGVAKTDNCTGFLEGWISKEVGQFQHLRDRIDAKEINKTITDVRKYTTGSLNVTVADLTSIKKFMEVNPTQNKYRQICDLQGFFLKEGGFLVNDVPSVKDLGKSDRCFDEEPTTAEVLDALDKMIDAFNEDHGTRSNAVSIMSVCRGSFICLGLLFSLLLSLFLTDKNCLD
ncbi:uncharacterized protein LOC114533505 [Dendronephthya gigantea]|uniref:uncharacterized protein LOC114533505 n=1 Tax=Dendronephthya gigantea TaxID=151771 RepID=UPI0010698F92|nr:uncharacterized protein LOC114533505 [Dendronephthya gigantea]